MILRHLLFLFFLIDHSVKKKFNQDLFHTTSRYYDYKIGKFIQTDTVIPEPSNSLALNRFTYTFNNPIRFTDPTGHVPENKNQTEILTNAYVLEFASSNGRYTHLVEGSLNDLIGNVGKISLGEPTDIPHAQNPYLKDFIALDERFGLHPEDSVLGRVVGSYRPSGITARRISMHLTDTNSDSAQAQMFKAMQYTFSGDPVYIQSSAFFAYGPGQRSDNIPRIAQDEKYKLGVAGTNFREKFSYIYVPNISHNPMHTVAEDGSTLKSDLSVGLGHEIGHIFYHRKIKETIFPAIDKKTNSLVLRNIFYNSAVNLISHPSWAGREVFAREQGIRDFTLDFENELVRPALNENFGYKKYQKREYYDKGTYGLEAQFKAPEKNN